ncbi:MAG: TonB-dependent receptor [Burkholderiaceae bacterium]
MPRSAAKCPSLLSAPAALGHRSAITIATALLCTGAGVGAQTPSGSLPTVNVQGSRSSVLGEASTANEGVVTQGQLEARTAYRPGELLEAVPGLVVTQHSGEGKANQFFLRGFNLDHGTDFRVTVDGMLVNQRSHGHGQGWTDLNFLIPELVDLLDYRKGPFYAAEGDFASAGAANIRYADRLPQGVFSVGVGTDGYARTLLADSPQLASGSLLYALELYKNDGPFVVGDNYKKFNGVLRYSQGDQANGFNVTAMAYRSNDYHATNQIPLRAVQSGALDRFSAIDQSDGGKSSRYSLSGAWQRSNDDSASKVNAYVVSSRLDLYSNFTYFLDNPADGDQFNQKDRRTTTGLNASHTFSGKTLGLNLGLSSDTTIGLQLQNDNIQNGLFNTAARQLLGTTRSDKVVESSLGLYAENTTRWSKTFRTVAGLRADSFRFDVRSDLAANSGKTTDQIVSPKLNLIFGPYAKTEFYASAGSGFHSNDARGTVISIDPKTGLTADRVPGLVRSQSAELGVRSELIPGLQTSLSVYQLHFDSELVFIGDAGNTEAGRASKRVGFEFNNYYKPTRWLTIDADIALARARFRDDDPAGKRIPGAVEGVASVALAVDKLGPWFGALQLRYFGPRPLIEDNSVRSSGTSTVNARVGYRFSKNTLLQLEVFNLADRKASSIDYFYESQLPGEAAPVADIHFHPIESRSFRLSLVTHF